MISREGGLGHGLGKRGILSFAAFHESFSACLQILVTLSVPRYMLQCVGQMIKHTAISVRWNVKLASKRRTLQWLLMGNAVVSNDRFSNIWFFYKRCQLTHFLKC